MDKLVLPFLLPAGFLPPYLILRQLTGLLGDLRSLASIAVSVWAVLPARVKTRLGLMLSPSRADAIVVDQPLELGLPRIS